MNPWLPYHNPNSQSRLRLFCFPHGGGGGTIYSGWAKGLPPTVELCQVELPGRETRFNEPPATRLSSLVQALAPALLPCLDKPFAFFGHSMGALIAFELARLLQKDRAIHPVHLFVSGLRAPQLPLPAHPVYALPEADFVAELCRRYDTLNELLQEESLAQMLLPLLRADFELYETYTYTKERSLTCPITAFAGSQDNEHTSEGLAAWKEQTTGSFELHILPGDHFFLRTARPQLLQMLSQKLGRG
jgi:medium-chain acyl-[acyl-carrier-protein] hydrolase